MNLQVVQKSNFAKTLAEIFALGSQDAPQADVLFLDGAALDQQAGSGPKRLRLGQGDRGYDRQAGVTALGVLHDGALAARDVRQ